MKYFSKNEKVRCISLIIITIILSAYINYHNIASIFTEPFIGYTKEMYVDGSDISGAINIGTWILNFMLQALSDIVLNIVLLLLSLLLLIPWRVICINKQTIIRDQEYTITRITIAAFLITNVIIGVISVLLSPRLMLVSVIIQNLMMMLIYFIIVLWPMKKRYEQNCKQNKDEISIMF